MEAAYENLLKTKKNFVFVGESGCGKSEIAINFALAAVSLAEKIGKKVHFFDMDQTKPLFRSRDVRDALTERGVVFHHEDQFFDAPTLVGGVRSCLCAEDNIVILDVGGDHLGARLIGGFADLLNSPNTRNFFVINPYRPWSREIVAIDGTMARILGMAHIDLANIAVMSNPNLGPSTTAEEVAAGHAKLKEMLRSYLFVDYLCAEKSLKAAVEKQTGAEVLPLRIYLAYEWN